MEQNKEKLISIMEKLLGNEFIMLLPDNKSCTYKVDWMNVTNMRFGGAMKEVVKCGVSIVDGYVMKNNAYRSYLSVDTYLGLEGDDFEVTDFDKFKGYMEFNTMLEKAISNKTRIFGYPKVWVDRFKISRL